jgi:hypothetical protein
LGKSRKRKRSTEIGTITAGFGLMYLLYDKRPGEALMLSSIPLSVTLVVSIVLILAGITLWRTWRISFALYICTLFASLTHTAFRISVIPSFWDTLKFWETTDFGSKATPVLSLLPIVAIIIEVWVIGVCTYGLAISYYIRRDFLTKQKVDIT